MIRLPGAEMQRLAGLVGRWSFLESPAPSNREALRGSWVFQRGPAGLSLLLEEVAHSPQESHRAHGILTWDSRDHAFHLYLADSRVAGVRELSGGWVADDLRLVARNGSGEDDPWRELKFSEMTAESYTLTIGGLRNAAVTAMTRQYRRSGER
jgi:hypothetical protein